MLILTVLSSGRLKVIKSSESFTIDWLDNNRPIDPQPLSSVNSGIRMAVSHRAGSDALIHLQLCNHAGRVSCRYIISWRQQCDSWLIIQQLGAARYGSGAVNRSITVLLQTSYARILWRLSFIEVMFNGLISFPLYENGKNRKPTRYTCWHYSRRLVKKKQ